MVTINGKQYKSFAEYGNAMKTDPNSNILVWDVQNVSTLNGTKLITKHGVCWYRGKRYEGEVTYRGNSLYVGGEYVKEV